MYFQFLIEDKSSALLIEAFMTKVADQYPGVLYSCKSFRGIGGFTRKNTVKATKTGKLLNDLATYLRGFNKSLQGTPAAIIVVLDNDTRDTEAFKKELQKVADLNMITLDHVFCIAVEEVEAWLLGDEKALMRAYPSARLATLRTYIQDSICGTWEVLADTVYPGGIAKFKRDCPTYMEVGEYKCEWAKRIGEHMNFSENKSPSFHTFMEEIYKRIPEI